MPTPTYNLIQETTISGSVTTTVTFSSIPNTFDDLVLIIRAKNALDEAVTLRFNSDSGTNYSQMDSVANGSTSSASNSASNTSIGLSGGQENQNYMYQIHINGYANANFTKCVFSTQFIELGTSANTIIYRGGRWNSTAVISTITLATLSGTNFVANSVFSLYGIKGSN